MKKSAQSNNDPSMKPKQPGETKPKPKKINWSAILIGFCSGIGGFFVALLIIGVPIAYLMGFRSRYQIRNAPIFSILGYVLLILCLLGMGYVTARLSRPYPKRNAMLLALFLSIPPAFFTWMTIGMWRCFVVFILVFAGSFLLPVEKKTIKSRPYYNPKI